MYALEKADTNSEMLWRLDNTDFTLTKKRRISHEAVDDAGDDDDQQNVDDDIYEECGEADGDLQQADNVMNDECKCFTFGFQLFQPFQKDSLTCRNGKIF